LASRRSHLTLVALLVAALVGVFFLGWKGSPIHRDLKEGLDLKGGLEVVLQAKPQRGHKLTAEDMDLSVSVIRTRIDALGVSEPVVTKQGANQIVIELPAVHDINRAAQIIGATAQLELYDLETSLVAPSIDASQNPVAETSLHGLLTSVQSGQKGTPSSYYLFNSRTKKPVAGPDDTLAALKADPAVKKLKPLSAASKKNKASLKTTAGFPTGYQMLSVPASRAVITCDGTTSVVCPGLNSNPAPGTTYYYLFKHTSPNVENPVPQMTGKDLKLSGTQQDFDPNGNVIVTMHFTGHGNKIFHNITRDEAIRGQTSGAFQHFAIVLDGKIRSFPYIDYKQNPDGIDPAGNGAEITGLASTREAKDLALVLRSGALRVPFETVERTDVSATLGKDSLREARNAAIGGLIVVVIFLLLLYRFLGVVAVIGLGVYCAFMYGAILLIGVTLTLPGFAGLILTIGVAADANVVIFERIKEEVRGGRSVRAAIAAGYEKGFRTIVDANVVTCITALILFAVATASVKGFALMLLIGTIISLITAVAATRAMLGLLAGFRWFANPRFMGATATEIPRWQRINVTGHMRLWLTVSIAAIVVSIGLIAIKGLNLGIDFKGGVQVSFTTPKPTSLSKVRSDIAEKGSVVQGRGKLTGADSYTSFQIRLKKLTPTQQDRLTTGLTEKLDAQKLGVKNVSASFSRQILRGAIVAIFVSFALIALYVTLRYRWRFAIPILRTLINDIPIALGVYAISGREVSAGTVAAILTILGYSVYDTIIVFDRVRENIKLMPSAPIATIANVSVWEVLRRSIVTSVITLLPIVALFIFGGATLRDFAFAIMVGISVGAVSTIFVATPLLTQLMERDPEFARRKAKPMDDAEERRLLRRVERAAAEEPTPATPLAVVEEAVQSLTDGDDEAKRERRRQRRKTRPHGRAR
jgi:SecD/SecF fusion protein